MRLRARGPVLAWLGLLMVVFWALVALLAPLIAPHPSGAMLRLGMLSPMSAAAPLGTDVLGRDMLSRIIYGARYTVGAALLATLIACAIGAVLGILAAVRGGWFDATLSRCADALISIPHLMLALVVVAALGSSLAVLIGTIAFSYVPGAFRIAPRARRQHRRHRLHRGRPRPAARVCATSCWRKSCRTCGCRC